MTELSSQKGYKNLIQDIGGILDEGRKQAYKTVNNILVKTYWEIGKRIVEFEQKGKITSEYGSKLLINLSKELSPLGKGFSRSNLTYMRLLYFKYPKSETLSHQLSWSHYFELLKVDDDLARNFYEKQSIKEKWSIRELKRQKNSMLFERIALSKNKKGVLEISEKGQIIEMAKDIIKEPYVLEFLGIPEDHKYSEKELEQKIIDNLQMFLLELGKGFTFVKRQFRITLNNRHYYADLVFYHRILKCFVIIDLKIGEVDHGDVGQMNMYLNYFKIEENTDDDNEPIGIILSAEKEHISVQYALGGISNKLFVSKYQLHLPKKEELEQEVKKIVE
jgi:predicted nuclease of restriction endonuclease-like (RecB) superfamily